MNTTERRVAITGVGAITSVGVGLQRTWDALCAGRLGLSNQREWLEAELQGFARLRTHLAGRIEDYDLLSDPEFPGFSNVLKPRDVEREMSRAAMMALRATAEALSDAGLIGETLEISGIDLLRTAVTLGSGIGGASGLSQLGAELALNTRPRATRMYQVQPDNPTVYTKRFFGAKGPSLGVSQACASGGIAIALGASMIERDEADVVIAGGAEALEPSLVALFEATGAASDSSDPAMAVRPFDVAAAGTVVAEGAGIVILESHGHALARGADVLAFVDGWAITGGTEGPTMMDEEGVLRAMRLAVERGELQESERVALSPHATGTRLGDQVEARAVARLASHLGGSGGGIVKVFPIKGNIGHTIGASGGIEAAVSVHALAAGAVPPSTTTRDGVDEVRELLPLSPGPNVVDFDAVLSNNMGFGDQNVSVLIRRPPRPEAG